MGRAWMIRARPMLRIRPAVLEPLDRIATVDDEEADLLARADDAAMRTLYRRYERRLYGFGLRLLGGTPGWPRSSSRSPSRGSGRAPAASTPRAERCARCCSRSRAGSPSISCGARRHAPSRPRSRTSAGFDALADEVLLAVTVRDAMMSLSPAHREVLELIYDEDLKLGEIALQARRAAGHGQDPRLLRAARDADARCASGASMAEHPDLVEWALGQLDPVEARDARGAPRRLRDLPARRRRAARRPRHARARGAGVRGPARARGARPAAAPAAPAAASRAGSRCPRAAAAAAPPRSCSSAAGRPCSASPDAARPGSRSTSPPRSASPRSGARSSSTSSACATRARTGSTSSGSSSARPAGAPRLGGHVPSRTSRAAGPCGCWPPPTPWRYPRLSVTLEPSRRRPAPHRARGPALARLRRASVDAAVGAL